MKKILFKKQMAEVFSFLFYSRKNGKRKTTVQMIGNAVLLLALFGFLVFSFYQMAEPMVLTIHYLEMDWFYFAFFTLISMLLGVLGSVFISYQSLFLAKDNELLGSMPINPKDILLVRMMGVYVLGTMYAFLVFLPGILAYQIKLGFNLTNLLIELYAFFLISLIILVLSCILGYVVAYISVHSRNKSYITVGASLLFIGIYYYFYFSFISKLNGLMLDLNETMLLIKGEAYYLYAIGAIATGDLIPVVIATVVSILALVITHRVLSKGYTKLTTTNRGEKKIVYKKEKLTSNSLSKALFQKELRYYLSNANYILNCSLGTFFLPVMAIGMILKKDMILEMMGILGGYSTLAIAAIICSFAAMNDITAPSISLEGMSLWIYQSLPVDLFEVLKAKLKLHIVISLPPVILCGAVACFVGQLPVLESVIILILSCLFVVFQAAFGLMINLLMPNIHWTNEAFAVKQSFSVLIGLFGGWVIIAGLAALYFFVLIDMTPLMFMLVTAGALVILILLIYRWLKTKGVEILTWLS